VALFDQLLVMGMLARESRSQLLQNRQLISLVGGSCDALGVIHP